MIFRLIVASLAICLTAVSTATAQVGEVRGRVMDAATSRPLEGVQLSVGGRFRTTTDAAGGYAITVSAGGPVVVRAERPGYRAEERQLSIAGATRVEADFALTPSAVALEELVVIGQPDATRRRAIGAAVSVVHADEVRAPVTSLSQLLQGREPGVTSIGASGTVGAAGVLVLRGMTSINESNSPVVYLDGVRVDASEKPLFYFSLGGQSTSRLNDINPADIERVEVVKGAAASTLYGSDASRGVIQIFTRKGRPGSTSMNASVRFGGSRIPDVLPALHPDPVHPNPNQLLERGSLQQYSVSLRGGVDRLRHYVSAGYQREDGSFPGNGFERGTGRVNLSLEPRTGVTLELNSGLTWSRAEMPFNDSFSYGVLYNVLTANPVVRGTPADPWGGTLLPVAYALDVSNVDDSYRFTQGVTLKHDAGAFSHRASVGLDVVNGTGTTRWPFETNRFMPRGGRWVAQRDNLNANLEYTATHSLALSDGVESTLSAGGQMYTVRDRRTYSAGSDFPAPGLELLGATTARIEVNEEMLDYTTGGLFVQEQLAFGDRLFLVGGVRIDGSSAFGDDFGLQPYPKASASYVVSDESWFRVPAVSSLRLRGGFGMAGAQPGAFDAMRTFSPFAANGGQPAIHAQSMGNPDLAPEVSEEWEGGFDAGLFDDRLELAATVYHQTTRDALLSRPVAPSLGFLTPQLVNVGRVRNTGLELGAEASLVRREGLAWSVDLSYARNRNEVLSLGGARPQGADFFFGTRVVEGYPLGGKWQNVQVGTDSRGYPVRSDTAHYLGTGIPPHTGGLGTRLGLAGVELFANAQWAAGHVVTNRTRADMIRNRTGAEYFTTVIANNDNPANPQTDAVKQLIARGNILGEYTEPGDWLRVRELGLSYELPQRWSRTFGSGRTALSVTGRNLFTVSRYSGPDPEVAGTLVSPALTPQPYFVPGNRQFATFAVSNDYFTVPQPRQVVVGIDVQF